MIGTHVGLRKFFGKSRRVSHDEHVADAGTDASIGADAPIRVSSQDRLRRVYFAERIAAVLSALSLDEGRVFAIRGGWGFGKSSLKYLVIERLRDRERGADYLDFNPWQWGDSDAIARALFVEIANALGGAYSEGANRRAAKLRGYGEILTGTVKPIAKVAGSTQLLTSMLTSASVVAVASAVGFAVPSVAIVAAAIAGIAGVLPLVGKAFVHFGRDRMAEPLDRIRGSLEASLRELTRPLVIFVDDIDRLEPDQIRLLLRQVKANANLPNLVFVLIYQPSIVEAALDPIADGDGAAFLQKVVQANFDLPTVPVSTVHRIFTEQLSALASAYAVEENGFNQVRWGNCLIGCIQPHVGNLRDARRLLSSIAVHLPLHAQADAFEVNVVDFLVLETLRVFESNLHGLLIREQDLLLQTRRFRGDNRQDTDRTRILALLDVVVEGKRDVARDVLKELFPQIEWAFGNMHYGPDWHQRWLSEKRVCSKRYFARYFELQTPEGELSESEFVAFLEASSDDRQLASVLDDIEARGLLPPLAARLDESVDRLPAANAPILLPAMFSLGQKLAATRAGGPFNSPWVSAWRATSWFLPRIPVEIRSELALEALRKTEALSVGAILIHLNDPEDRKDEDGRDFAPSLDADTVLAMKREWLRQIEVLSEDPDRLLAHPDLLNLLYRWRDYSGSMDAPRSWAEATTEDDGRFTIFVTRMMSRGTTSAWGDRVAAPHDTFSKESVEELVGLQAAQDRIQAIDLGRLDGDEVHAISVLSRHLANWNAGDPDD